MACTLVGAFPLTGCRDDDPATEVEKIDVNLSNLSNLGDVLVDENDMTLYFFIKDVGGLSMCEDGCLYVWPVFYHVDISVANALDTIDFGVITRNDGSKQATYKGWLLSYHGRNAVVNYVNEEGIGGIWYFAKPNYTVILANQEVHGQGVDYFVYPLGDTPYFFTNDGQDVSHCADGCLTAWPIFNRGLDAIVPSILTASDFGQIDSNNDYKQMTFQGQPLYYFVQDQNRGNVNGGTVEN